MNLTHLYKTTNAPLLFLPITQQTYKMSTLDDRASFFADLTAHMKRINTNSRWWEAMPIVSHRDRTRTRNQTIPIRGYSDPSHLIAHTAWVGWTTGLFVVFHDCIIFTAYYPPGVYSMDSLSFMFEPELED